MSYYNHDIMHCSQNECPLKDSCYRYHLGIEIGNTAYEYATFYQPENEEEILNCEHYLDIKDF